MNLLDALAEDGYTLVRAESYEISRAWVVLAGGADVGLVRPAAFGSGRRWEARVGRDRVLDLTRYPTRGHAALAVVEAHRRRPAA